MNRIIPIRLFRVEQFRLGVQLRRFSKGTKEKRRTIVRLKIACIIAALVPLLVSCASTPLSLAPVGPVPGAIPGPEHGTGSLQVYTEPQEYNEDDLSYFPHTDYQLLTADGKRLRRVWNHSTREDETPAIISIPSGQYLIRAQAEFYGLVTVPVVIKPNQLTKVILQPGWDPGTNVVRSELVQMPEGYCVGWRAELAGAR